MGLFNIWVSEKCNMNCKYCYEGHEKDNTIFNESNINKLLNFIKEKGKEWDFIMINFHGGEPLIAFDIIKKIIAKSNNLNGNILYSLTTNGLLLTEDIISYLKNEKVYLSISLDGNQKVNDINRIDYNGKGTYKHVIEKVKMALQQEIDLRIRMTITPDTVEYLAESVKTLFDQGCNLLIAVPDIYDDRWNENYIEILEKQVKLSYDLAQSNKKEFFFYRDYNECKPGRCDGGIGEFNISANGDIYPCSYVVNDKEYLIGSLDSGINEDKLEKFKKIYTKNNEICIGCTNEKICLSTRCKFINKKVTGDYLHPVAMICALENMMHKINNCK